MLVVLSVFPSPWRCVRWLCGLLLAWACLPGLLHADTLRVLAWPGYADADLVKTFEQRTGSQVNVTVIDSDDTLWERINQNQGRDFDVFAVNTAELQRYIRAKLAGPIDMVAISNSAHQLPRFRELNQIKGLVHAGQVFGVPYTYAEMGLIYDRQQLQSPPTSLQALWDSRYHGKVLLYNGSTHIFSLAAQAMGHRNPFTLTAEQWPEAVHRLIALRRNALGFYTQPDESVSLFKAGHAALMLANYGSQQVQLLKSAGVNVGYAIPKEGALAWLDTWAITRQSKSPGLAHAWINYMLEPGPSQALITRQGLANTVSESPYLQAKDTIVWLEPVEDSWRRQLLWERIYSGDRAAKVLAP